MLTPNTVDKKSTIRRYVYLPCALCLLIFVSCQEQVIFEQNVDILDCAWDKDTPAYLTIAAPPDSVAGYYRLAINFRHTEDYPYRNIYFFITTTAPDGANLRDTVQYELANEHGRWLGKIGRYWIDHRLLYRSRIRFPQQGDYLFGIQQGMRADTLYGAGAVGLRLEKMKD